MESICARVSEASSKVGTNEAWNITKGCYENGAYTKMTRAIPDFEYKFDKVAIEVRSMSDDPSAKVEVKPEVKKTEPEPPKTTSIWKTLMWICLILFIIFLIIFILLWV